MVALVALVLGVSRPPPAYVSVGANRVPLAVSSWCWGARCGAPISAPTQKATAPRGTTVRIELKFLPTRVRVAVAGVQVRAETSGREITWRATRQGGMTVNVATAKGWFIYVGRLKLR